MAVKPPLPQKGLYIAGSFALSLAVAGPSGAAEPWRIDPAAQIRTTLTDNVSLAPDNAKQSDLVFEIVPSVRVTSDTRRLKANFAYHLNGIVHTRDPSRSELLQELNGAGTFTAVDEFFFIDVAGNISQEVVSPFGSRPPSNANISENRTEDSAFRVSPWIRGRFGFGADYTVRYSETLLRTGAEAGDTRVHELTARLANDSGSARLSWALEGFAQKNDFRFGRDTDDQRVRAVLTYQVDADWQVNGTAGVERTNMATLDYETKPTYGAGFEWNPETRTKVHGNWERRFFGDAWQYGIQHRLPNLVFTLTDSQDVTTDAQRLIDAAGSGGVAFDLLFNYLGSRIADPAARATEARRLLSTGAIPADLNLPPDFLVGGVFVDRRLQASVGVVGVRNTAVASVYYSRRNQIGGFTALPFEPGASSNVREDGATLAFSHHLSPITSLTALTTWRKTTDASGSGLDSRQWEAHLLCSTRFGPRMGGSLEYRHVRFDGGTSAASDYTENAIVASVAYQF